MPRTYPINLEAEGHRIQSVSVTCGLRPISDQRGDSPAHGTHIEIPAMLELLDLIAAGVVTAQEVRNDLHNLAVELNREQDQEDERMFQELLGRSAAGPGQRGRGVIQRADARWVYAVSTEDNPNIIKIGVASNLRNRIRGLQTGAATSIHLRWSIRGGLPLETHLHEKFRRRRMSGEWFDFRGSPDPVKLISAAASAFLSTVE